MREGEGSILGTFELKKSQKTFSFLFVITQHIKEMVSRKFSGLLRIIKFGQHIKEMVSRNISGLLRIIKFGNRIKFVKFFKTGMDRAMFRVHFAKLQKNDLKSTISFYEVHYYPQCFRKK